jgi:hypothetical protein
MYSVGCERIHSQIVREGVANCPPCILGPYLLVSQLTKMSTDDKLFDKVIELIPAQIVATACIADACLGCGMSWSQILEVLAYVAEYVSDEEYGCPVSVSERYNKDGDISLYFPTRRQQKLIVGTSGIREIQLDFTQTRITPMW